MHSTSGARSGAANAALAVTFLSAVTLVVTSGCAEEAFDASPESSASPSANASNEVATFSAAGTASGTSSFLLIRSTLDDGYVVPSSVGPDGHGVVGFAGVVRPSPKTVQGFLWRREGGVRVIAPAGADALGPAGILALGSSHDLAMIAGVAAAGLHPFLFRWSAQGGAERLADVAGLKLSDPSRQISSDGSAIVGAAAGQAFRWTSQTGLVSLGVLPGDAHSEALAVSADGRVVLGHSYREGCATPAVFRWTPETGMLALGVPAGLASCQFLGQMSADGSVVFGRCLRPGSSYAGALFRWTAGTGSEALLVPPRWANARPRGVASDGGVLVGELEVGSPTPWSSSSEPSPTPLLFRWTESTCVLPLDTGEPGRSVVWEGSDGEGAYLVANSSSSGSSSDAGRRRRGLRWDAWGQVTSLEPLGGDDVTEVKSISADGRIAAGSSGGPCTASALPDASLTATIWDAKGQPRRVSDVVKAAGGELHGARLVSAQVSRDGSTLMGGAYDVDGRKATWIATLR
jgi:uncharacterized membrane protein